MCTVTKISATLIFSYETFFFFMYCLASALFLQPMSLWVCMLPVRAARVDGVKSCRGQLLPAGIVLSMNVWTNVVHWEWRSEA